MYLPSVLRSIQTRSRDLPLLSLHFKLSVVLYLISLLLNCDPFVHPRAACGSSVSFSYSILISFHLEGNRQSRTKSGVVPLSLSQWNRPRSASGRSARADLPSRVRVRRVHRGLCVATPPRSRGWGLTPAPRVGELLSCGCPREPSAALRPPRPVLPAPSGPGGFNSRSSSRPAPRGLAATHARPEPHALPRGSRVRAVRRGPVGGLGAEACGVKPSGQDRPRSQSGRGDVPATPQPRGV